MHYSTLITFVAAVVGVNGMNVERKNAACPAVWSNVVKDLTAMFLDTSVNPSQCNDDARAALRVC
jgi:hypothetical protein